MNYLFWIIFILGLLNQANSAASYLYYLIETVTAMDVNYLGARSVYFATSAYTVKKVNAKTRAAINTFATGYTSSINSISVSRDDRYFIIGTEQFEYKVIEVSTGATKCSWKQLRGSITSTSIFPNNDMYAVGTRQGYIYYGWISNCTIKRQYVSNKAIISIDGNSDKNQIWAVSEESDSVFVLNVTTMGKTNIVMPTSLVKSVSVFPAYPIVYMGVCTVKAFYLVDNTGTIRNTIPYPTIYTQKCRIMQENSGYFSGDYYLTALAQVERNYKLSTDRWKLYLWNIWRIKIASGYRATLYYEQQNLGSQYGAVFSAILADAAVLEVTWTSTYAVSFQRGKPPFQNTEIQNAMSPCGTGYFRDGSGYCVKCNWNDVGNKQACTSCTDLGDCTSCLSYYYLSPIRTCSACPSNCYECLSSTQCDICYGDYSNVNYVCKPNNYTGCSSSLWNNSLSICYYCQIGYFNYNRVSCMKCATKYPNCTVCDKSKCFECMGLFYIPDVNTGNCQLCSFAIEGCASCLNDKYCYACFDNYPYFDTISATQRTCKPACHENCFTCEKYNYDKCLTCDSNKTMISGICQCLPAFPIQNPQTLQCTACSYNILNCATCTNSTYCTGCASTYYLNPINSTHRSCQKCNYTCGSCSSNWATCTSCRATDNRIFDSTNTKCVCKNSSYFQYLTSAVCELCWNFISNCNICNNQTMCVGCFSGFYLKTVSAGNIQCLACSLPCSQCWGTPTNCTDCVSGREHDPAAFKCNCPYGSYQISTTGCSPCFGVLGVCLKCSNNSICLLCSSETYFVMDAGKKKCDVCSSNCLTCSVWTTKCATCDALAHRKLNATTSTCYCETGYTEDSGRCTNCGNYFDKCTSCNSTTCFACSPGYSLAYGGLKCIDCAATFPGCILCIDGICVKCNTTQGYELSYNKCICQPGYYRKDIQCFTYKMGKSIGRSFPAYASYSQHSLTEEIQISVYFQCEQIFMPYPLNQSIRILLNSMPIAYKLDRKNTTFNFTLTPVSEHSKAEITVEFINRTIFDKEQYIPTQHVFTFQKNIYLNSNYLLAQSYKKVYENKIINALRWLMTMFALFGCPDLVLMLVVTTHLLPAFLMLGLSLPLPVKSALESMIKINEKSFFIFTDINLSFEPYETFYTETYNIEGSIIDTKIMDIITLLFLIAFYSVIGPMLYKFIPEGKIRKWWEHKFIHKRYSTFANFLICFTPTFLLSATLNFNMQKYDSSILFSSAIALLLVCLASVFIFIHGTILLSTQFADNFKNEDCYLGSSCLEQKSIPYVISMMIIIVWAIPMLYMIKGVACLPILIVVIVFHISFFRFWNNFPSKVLYFIKLLYAVCLLVYFGTFLVFEISENYAPISNVTLEVLGLCTLVNIIVLLCLSLLELLFTFMQTVYRLCKTNQNLVENVDIENAENNEINLNETNSVYKVQITSIKESNMAKMTSKQEHMMKFRKNHLMGNTGQSLEFAENKFMESKSNKGA